MRRSVRAGLEYRDRESFRKKLESDLPDEVQVLRLVFDELPYLGLSSPELPSVLQQWSDHEARETRLVVAMAGSSEGMMRGHYKSSWRSRPTSSPRTVRIETLQRERRPQVLVLER